MHDAGALSGEIARRFREEPGPHLRWFLVGKPIALWSWNIVQGQGGPFVYEVALSPYYRPGAVAASAYLMRVTHWPLVLLGLAGALLVWLPSASRSLAPATLIGGRAASLLLLYFLLLHMVLAPYPRYSVPLRPTLYGLAMLAAWVAFDALRTRLRARPATATGPVPGRGDQCLRITRR